MVGVHPGYLEKVLLGWLWAGLSAVELRLSLESLMPVSVAKRGQVALGLGAVHQRMGPGRTKDPGGHGVG